MNNDLPEGPIPLMTPGEVARALRVDPKTVTRWAASDLLPSIRTPGGHRRFPRPIIEAILAGKLDPRKGGGPRAPVAKVLTPAQADVLRREYRSGAYTVSGLAAKYNIPVTAVYAHVGALDGLTDLCPLPKAAAPVP